MQIIVEEIREGRMLREGAGVKLQRFIGAERGNPFEPILLFDYFHSNNPLDYQAGFPHHPHRGFETITYLLKGTIHHRDNHGHEGHIAAGDMQWMTAGAGIIHSEMPMGDSNQWLQGIQIWLNLPAAQKMIKPHYQEFKHHEFSIEQDENQLHIKVLAGETTKGTGSPLIATATEPYFFDIHMPAHSSWEQKIPDTHQSLVFVLEGELCIAEQWVSKECLAALSAGDVLQIKTEKKSAQFLFIAAKKLHEPIARLGPFVMSNAEEIAAAIEDFRLQRF